MVAPNSDSVDGDWGTVIRSVEAPRRVTTLPCVCGAQVLDVGESPTCRHCVPLLEDKIALLLNPFILLRRFGCLGIFLCAIREGCMVLEAP